MELEITMTNDEIDVDGNIIHKSCVGDETVQSVEEIEIWNRVFGGRRC